MAVRRIVGDDQRMVSALVIDSRRVVAACGFIAIRGTSVDGHQYIQQAIASGATVIVAETLPGELDANVTYIQVADSAQAAGQMAAAFYGNPSERMHVVGVTGTNGKTTVATLLFQLFSRLGYRCGLISTVQNHIADQIVPSTHTTPDAISLQALLAQIADAGCTHAFMEVSSHAVHQQRIAGVRFSGAIFTNISHDHLDYHKTFDEYIRVKKQFFDGLDNSAFSLTNLDDKRGAVMLQNTEAKRYGYSLKAPADFKGKVLENNLTGLILTINQQEAHFRMLGTFNAYNLLAVFGAATLLGIERMEALAILSDLHGAPGRFETFVSPHERVLGIVDYAHTPDALLNVLATVNQLRKGGEQLITVVGCGGDRDKTKRPLMAEVACEHSDRVIFTADNPRTEDPESILNDMESGLTSIQKRKTLRITDRHEAIKVACTLTQPGDIVLIAGKGHETYQEVNGVRLPFDDRTELKNAFDILQK